MKSGLFMQKIRKICVYCGSSSGVDPVFIASAKLFGSILAENDIGLVYGGGDLGLMGAVAHATLSAGGHVTGIIPRFLQKREHMLDSVQDLLIVEDMHERKRLMFEKADAFVALPGGIGTLEELVEQLTWVQLERHDKPVLIADIGGFWGPLLALLDHMREQGFIRPHCDARYLVCERVEDILPLLQADFVKKAEPHRELRPEL
jgi:uncharacterized protein (TIGR00730 family)